MTIKCKNQTHSIRANRVLTKNNIPSKIEKTTVKNKGCIYSISFSDSFYKEAIYLMKTNKVSLHDTEKDYYGEIL